MTEYGAVKRFALILLSALGCLCAFYGVLTGVGAILQKSGNHTILTLSDREESQGMAQLPCRVEGTDLIASKLVMYEGPFLETGGDVPVSDITALILYNSGDREIAQAEVVLAGEEELTFFASNIMPGAKVLVLEKNAAPWKDRDITSCAGWINEDAGQTLPEDTLQILEADMGTLVVTNISREKLTDVWLFHKNYLEDGNLYIGGITYLTQIGSLEVGQSVTVEPAHYASGYSRIIKAQDVA